MRYPKFIQKYIQAYENELHMADPEYVAVFFRGKYTAAKVPTKVSVTNEVEALKWCLYKLGWEAKLSKI